MPTRRRVLSSALGLAGTAIGAGYGTGAFARLTAERDFALAIANEAGSQLPIEPQGVTSNAGPVVAHALDRDDAGADPNATIPRPIRVEADPADLAPLTHAQRDFKRCLSVDHAVRVTLRHTLKLHRRPPSALMGLIKKWVWTVTSDRPPCPYHDLPANGPPRHDSHTIAADPMAWPGGRQHATHPDLVGPPTVSEVVVATVS